MRKLATLLTLLCAVVGIALYAEGSSGGTANVFTPKADAWYRLSVVGDANGRQGCVWQIYDGTFASYNNAGNPVEGQLWTNGTDPAFSTNQLFQFVEGTDDDAGKYAIKNYAGKYLTDVNAASTDKPTYRFSFTADDPAYLFTLKDNVTVENGLPKSKIYRDETRYLNCADNGQGRAINYDTDEGQNDNNHYFNFTEVEGIPFVVSTATGTLYKDGTQANQNYNSVWKSTETLNGSQLVISAGGGKNNMSSGTSPNINFASGQAQDCNFTITAPTGYKVASVSFSFKFANTADASNSTTVDGEAVTVDAQTKTKTFTSAADCKFNVNGDNKAVEFSDFTVFLVPDPVESTDPDDGRIIVPTTITDGEFAADTKWYKIRLGNNAKYMTDKTNDAGHIMISATETNNNGDLWCFVGSEDNGYEIYNRATGTTRKLAYPADTKSGDAATLTSESGLSTKWRVTANGDAYAIKLFGKNNSLNDFNGAEVVRSWAFGDDTTDGGSKVTFMMATELPADPVFIPTTITSDGQFAADTKWYKMLMREDAGTWYITDNTDENGVLKIENTDADVASHLWCFVGDPNYGFQAYNKATGTSKRLSLPAEISDGSAVTLSDETGRNYKWQIDTNGDAYSIKSLGTKHSINDYGGARVLKIWDINPGASDGGSKIRFVEFDGNEIAYNDDLYPVCDAAKDGTITRTDRYTPSVNIPSAYFENEELSGLQAIGGDMKVYWNKVNDHVFSVAAGETITAKINYQGHAMFKAVYVDFARNGFSESDNADLMGVVKQEPGSNPDAEEYKIPSFKVPEDAEGDYRIRFKVDWEGTSPNVLGKNDIAQNGGIIVDAILRVEKVAGVVNTILFADMDLSNVTVGYNDNAKKNTNTAGGPISFDDCSEAITSGVGVHAASKAAFRLREATHFRTLLGTDAAASDAADHGDMKYVITLYKGSVAQSPTIIGELHRHQAPADIDIDLTGYDFMLIDIQTDGANYADWASYGNAVFTYTGDLAPCTITEDEIGSADPEGDAPGTDIVITDMQEGTPTNPGKDLNPGYTDTWTSTATTDNPLTFTLSGDRCIGFTSSVVSGKNTAQIRADRTVNITPQAGYYVAKAEFEVGSTGTASSFKFGSAAATELTGGTSNHQTVIATGTEAAPVASFTVGSAVVNIYKMILTLKPTTGLSPEEYKEKINSRLDGLSAFAPIAVVAEGADFAQMIADAKAAIEYLDNITEINQAVTPVFAALSTGYFSIANRVKPNNYDAGYLAASTEKLTSAYEESSLTVFKLDMAPDDLGAYLLYSPDLAAYVQPQPRPFSQNHKWDFGEQSTAAHFELKTTDDGQYCGFTDGVQKDNADFGYIHWGSVNSAGNIVQWSFSNNSQWIVAPAEYVAPQEVIVLTTTDQGALSQGSGYSNSWTTSIDGSNRQQVTFAAPSSIGFSTKGGVKVPQLNSGKNITITPPAGYFVSKVVMSVSSCKDNEPTSVKFNTESQTVELPNTTPVTVSARGTEANPVASFETGSHALLAWRIIVTLTPNGQEPVDGEDEWFTMFAGEENGNVIYSGGLGNTIKFGSTGLSNTNRTPSNQWRVEVAPEGGYYIFNKAAGAEYGLAYKDAGNNQPASLQKFGTADYHFTWDIVSITNDNVPNAYGIRPHDINNRYINKQGGDMKFWESADNGSSIRFIMLDGSSDPTTSPSVFNSALQIGLDMIEYFRQTAPWGHEALNVAVAELTQAAEAGSSITDFAAAYANLLANYTEEVQEGLAGHQVEVHSKARRLGNVTSSRVGVDAASSKVTTVEMADGDKDVFTFVPSDELGYYYLVNGEGRFVGNDGWRKMVTNPAQAGKYAPEIRWELSGAAPYNYWTSLRQNNGKYLRITDEEGTGRDMGDHANNSNVATGFEFFTYHPDANGIQGVDTDAAITSADELFTIQGVRISRENAAPGIYLLRRAGKTIKVLIR